jgi:polyphenol oxidase
MMTLDRSALQAIDGFSFFKDPRMEEVAWIRHAFLTRRGGVSLPPYHTLNWGGNNGDLESHVRENRNLTARMFGVDPARFLLLQQVHQDGILVLKDTTRGLPTLLEYDAVITNLPDLFIGILTADCLPVLIADRTRRVIAAVHAGRQGTSLHILNKVLRKMGEIFESSPDDLLITLGPSIGPCCYEIDHRVFSAEWKPFSVSREENKWWVNLAEINISLLLKEGVAEGQISRIDLCTCCHPDLFYSYRRDGKTGRQFSFIGLH